MTDILRETIVTQEKIIRLLEEQNERLKIENSLLKNEPSRNSQKNKWGKVPYKKRHLKLIALNGVPVNGKEVFNDF